MRVGIEVGGTFTDLVAVDGSRVEITKVPSTPKSPDIGAFAALASAGIDPESVTDLVHGSTVATNAILERKGARIAFVATKGFRDILFIQRHDRRSIYDLKYRKPQPPVSRRDCFEVAERIDARGAVVSPLDIDAVRSQLIPALAAGNYDAVAICLLSSYASPVHEQAVKAEIGAALPHLAVTCSSEVAMEFREYERASTTSLSAYVQPVIDGYIERFEATLAKAGFSGRFSIMQSNGGRIPAAGMRQSSITALFSGPAGGVVGAIRQADRSGVKDFITFDMGGTSTDVSLVKDGEASISPETEVDGLPVRIPVLDIVTVGAGGGSLVWVDDGGMLRVGPRSAGAEPGPVCYGRGGTLPTITDAHVVRGTINPEGFLGGDMHLDVDGAYRSFEEVAKALGMDVRAAAAAAIRLAVANIVRAIQLVSTERGRDPRDYALLPYGGAGPLLAAEIAEELGVRTILVPPNPGVISALGLITSDFTRLSGRTVRAGLADSADVIRSEFATFQLEAGQDFRQLGLTGEHRFNISAEMRYLGQAFELSVPLSHAELPSLNASILAERFIDAHRRTYFHGGERGREIELVGVRFGIMQPLDSMPVFRERQVERSRPASTRVWIDGSARDAAVHDAARLPDAVIAGPCMLEGYSSSTWVPAGWSVRKDEADNIILTRGNE